MEFQGPMWSNFFWPQWLFLDSVTCEGRLTKMFIFFTQTLRHLPRTSSFDCLSSKLLFLASPLSSFLLHSDHAIYPSNRLPYFTMDNRLLSNYFSITCENFLNFTCTVENAVHAVAIKVIISFSYTYTWFLSEPWPSNQIKFHFSSSL